MGTDMHFVLSFLFKESNLQCLASTTSFSQTYYKEKFCLFNNIISELQKKVQHRWAQGNKIFLLAMIGK